MYLYRLPQGKPVRRIKAYQAAISLTALSPDGQFALTFGRDDMQHMKLKLWKISSASLVRAIALGDDQIRFLAISPDNRRPLTGGDQISQRTKTRCADRGN